MSFATFFAPSRISVTFSGALLLLLVASARADPPPNYYASVNTSNASALRATLHQVIDDHTRFPYTASGTDTWVILESAQQDPANAANILDVYRNASYVKAGGGNSFYDREHSWPKSHGFPNDSGSNYPYTDCHLLHLSDSSYNGSRGDNPYGTCGPSCTPRITEANGGQGGLSGPYPNDDNWVIGPGGVGGLLGRWETWIGRRGDVARGLLYADVRYEGGVHGVTGAAEPDLILTDNESSIAATSTGSNEPVAYMGMLSVLLAWHAQDPPDAFERRRNDVVSGYQGNRNPFVDHPEWVQLLFGPTSGGCTTPAECDDGLFCNGAEACTSGTCGPGAPPCTAPNTCDETQNACVPPAPGGSVWINEFHYDNASTDTGEFVEVAGTAGTNLEGWSLIGYSGADGALYATIPLSGIIPNQQGCAGTLAFSFAGLQNGSPDGIALVDASDRLVEFISYEGSFSVSTGPAAGTPSTDVGVAETTSTPVGQSLALIGSGRARANFTWRAPAAQSPGAPNSDQTVAACTTPAAALVPALGSARNSLFFGLALAVLGAAFRRRGSRS